MPASHTLTRVLTAAVLVPVVVAVVWWGPKWLIAIATGVVVLAAVWEFCVLCSASRVSTYRAWVMICAAGMVFSQYDSTRCQGDCASGFIGYPDPLIGLPLSFWLVIFVVGAAIRALARPAELAGMLGSAVASAGALVYVALPLSFVVLMSREVLILVLITVWIGDTAAYFTGRALGRHLLASAISPKKTWEGAVANVVFSVAAFVFGAYILVVYRTMTPLEWVQLGLVGLLISVTGQLGDLFESAFKRSAGVKDSGTILPGHGGVLDRIDALIFAVPMTWAYTYFALSHIFVR